MSWIERCVFKVFIIGKLLLRFIFGSCVLYVLCKVNFNRKMGDMMYFICYLNERLWVNN